FESFPKLQADMFLIWEGGGGFTVSNNFSRSRMSPQDPDKVGSTQMNVGSSSRARNKSAFSQIRRKSLSPGKE
ncbi:hypothetical protein Tco_0393113, partial [Tanacetum coccineum]